jgi:hypothetical protein
MAYSRITVILKLNEKAALSKLANHERRDLRQQAAYLVRESLERLGWLQPTPPTPAKRTEVVTNEPTA